uniref:PDZ domain-containing protein n=1 Tax=Cyanoderma ruficeps TaxID=181631 RepID=A0A8C3QUK1_9PASS
EAGARPSYDIRPRLCHVTRDKSGFGFSVSCPEGTKGTFQLSVLQDGPADRAGVPPGCWLLELNGASVKSYSHTQLSKKVPNVTEHPVLLIQLKQSGNKVTLLVASSAVEEFYRLRGLRVTAALADTSRLPFKVRELHLVKGPAGYGFLLKEDDCSQFLWDVDAGLPAERAGMKEGDRVLAVNGESIEGLDHEQTVHRIRAREDQVTLLVIDPAGDEFYHSVGFGGTVLLWAVHPSLFCSSRSGCPLCSSLRTVTPPQAPARPPCPLAVAPLHSVTLRWDPRDLCPG